MDFIVIVKYILVIISTLLIIAILLQNRGGGIGSVFGSASGGDLYKSRRGFEAFLYNSTIILAILISVLSLVIAILNV